MYQICITTHAATSSPNDNKITQLLDQSAVTLFSEANFIVRIQNSEQNFLQIRAWDAVEKGDITLSDMYCFIYVRHRLVIKLYKLLIAVVIELK